MNKSKILTCLKKWQLIEIIERLLEDSEPTWIPVTPETLPKAGSDVLIYTDPSFDVRTQDLHNVNPESIIWKDGTIRFWMPFPKPPKEEADARRKSET